MTFTGKLASPGLTNQLLVGGTLRERESGPRSASRGRSRLTLDMDTRVIMNICKILYQHNYDVRLTNEFVLLLVLQTNEKQRN